MRTSKKIDYDAEAIGDGETMIRLLCSPLYYDRETHIVSAEAFNLRMMGRNQTEHEQYASLGRKPVLEEEGHLEDYLQLGYQVWDNKEWEVNEYAGYGTFVCDEARKVKPSRIEINPLVGGNKGHVGLFYVKSDEEYFKGPLPKDQAEILEMLGELSRLIANTIVETPVKKNS